MIQSNVRFCPRLFRSTRSRNPTLLWMSVPLKKILVQPFNTCIRRRRVPFHSHHKHYHHNQQLQLQHNNNQLFGTFMKNNKHHVTVTTTKRYITRRLSSLSTSSLTTTTTTTPTRLLLLRNTTVNKNRCTNTRHFQQREHTSSSSSSSNNSKNNNNLTSRSIGSWIRTGSLFGISLGFLYGGYTFYDHIGNRNVEGLVRAIRFYSFAIPKYMKYRLYMIMYPNDDEKTLALWDELHTNTASDGLDLILQLKGFYIKCGQSCASNIGNGFPMIWQHIMSILQDQCPYEDYYTIIRPILEREYHVTNIHDIFEFIDPIPIGSASIGQVHRAILKIPKKKTTTTTTFTTTSSTDETTMTTNMTNEYESVPVVIKICYPYVESLLRGDVRTLKLFCQLVQPVHVPSLQEMEHQFATEFNYTIEGQHLQIVRNNLIHAGLCSSITNSDHNDNHHFANHTNNNNKNNKNNEKKSKKMSSSNRDIRCTIPVPYLDYCTKHVLVMEEIKGEKLIDALRKNVEKIATLQGLSVDEFIQQQQQQTKKDHKDNDITIPMTGPTASEMDRINQMLLLRRRLRKITHWIYNYTIGLLLPLQNHQNIANNIDDDNDHSHLLLNHAKLVDDLIYIHGHEVLVDGIFNSDPHPGNILLCTEPDGTHQLGLIDYGQVKKLTKEKRHLFAKLIIALADNNKEQIIHSMIQAGYQSKYMNPDNMYRYAKVSYDEDNKTLTNGLHIQLFAEYLQGIDPIITLPEDFLAIGRTSLILRGLAHSLQQSRSVAKIWKPIAERVLNENI